MQCSAYRAISASGLRALVTRMSLQSHTRQHVDLLGSGTALDISTTPCISVVSCCTVRATYQGSGGRPDSCHTAPAAMARSAAVDRTIRLHQLRHVLVNSSYHINNTDDSRWADNAVVCTICIVQVLKLASRVVATSHRLTQRCAILRCQSQHGSVSIGIRSCPQAPMHILCTLARTARSAHGKTILDRKQQMDPMSAAEDVDLPAGTCAARLC